MDHMKNFPIRGREDALTAIRGGAIQSVTIEGGSVTFVIANHGNTLEIGALGEVELKEGGGEGRNIFSFITDDVSRLIGSQIADVLVEDSGLTIETETPRWTITLQPGVDYAAEISCVTRSKDTAFFY